MVAQTVKNLPAMWETLVGSLGGEDPTSVFLSGESPWTRGTWWATIHGVGKSQIPLNG